MPPINPQIEGAFLAEIHGTTADGQIITCKAMIYVSRDVQGFYLSYTTMIDLGMLPKNFPTPGCALAAPDLGTVHSVQEKHQTTAAMSERPIDIYGAPIWWVRQARVHT